MKNFLRSFAAVAVLALAPGLASATTVTYQTTSGAYGGVFGGNGYAAVDVTSGANPSKHYAGVGGAFALKSTVPGFEAFTAFCVDLLQYISNGNNTYATSSTPATFPDARTANLKKLFETGYKGLDLTNAAKSAGFQLAVWEIAFESGGTYDIFSGNFKSNLGPGNAAANFAKTLLDNLNGAKTQSYQLTFFTSAGNQDVVTVSEVPVPAAGLMLLAGLGGLAALRRKRKAA